MIIGVDPGLNGAIALVDGETLIQVQDMPTLPKPAGKGKEVNGYLLADILRDMIDQGGEIMWIENVGGRPGEVPSRAFNFGRAAGAPYYVAAALGMPCRLVSPAAWKRHHGLIRTDKQQSRALALSLWPAMRDEFRLQKHVDRAEAALIAAYGGSQ